MKKTNLKKLLKRIPKIDNRWDVPNQYLITLPDGTEVFQSYDSIVAINTGEEVILDEKTWDLSKTTGKYRNLFLDCDKKTCEFRIQNGRYTLANLNGGGK